MLGVPIKVLHEAQGLEVTVELLSTGLMYRGRLSSVEDSMNVQLRNVIETQQDGQVRRLDHVLIRGSQIRFFRLPDNLAQVPMLRDFSTHSHISGEGNGSGKNTSANFASSSVTTSKPPPGESKKAQPQQQHQQRGMGFGKGKQDLATKHSVRQQQRLATFHSTSNPGAGPGGSHLMKQ